jgi:hypothetical protein
MTELEIFFLAMLITPFSILFLAAIIRGYHIFVHIYRGDPKKEHPGKDEAL